MRLGREGATALTVRERASRRQEQGTDLSVGARGPSRMIFRNHPLRAALSEEMHLRRLPSFAAPYRMVQIVTVLGEAGTADARAHIDKLANSARELVPISAKYGVLEMGKFVLVWERHTEFATYTLLCPGEAEASFDPDLFEPVISTVLAEMPGETVRATQVALIADPSGFCEAGSSTLRASVAEPPPSALVTVIRLKALAKAKELAPTKGSAPKEVETPSFRVRPRWKSDPDGSALKEVTVSNQTRKR